MFQLQSKYKKNSSSFAFSHSFHVISEIQSIGTEIYYVIYRNRNNCKIKKGSRKLMKTMKKTKIFSRSIKIQHMYVMLNPIIHFLIYYKQSNNHVCNFNNNNSTYHTLLHVFSCMVFFLKTYLITNNSKKQQ